MRVGSLLFLMHVPSKLLDSIKSKGSSYQEFVFLSKLFLLGLITNWGILMDSA